VQRIDSWTLAREYYEGVTWENTTLEAQNALTEHLADRYQARFERWNDIAGTGREFIKARVEPKISVIESAHNLGEMIIADIQWNILGALMEDAYRDCRPPHFFFHQLLCIYEDGHLPCGWVDGEWPNGRLVVF
jgi:hypothetical protein